jgi:hypothetical protein
LTRATGAPRAQLSIRRDRPNYDPIIAGLGTDKAQRYFASDLTGFRLCDSTEIAVVEVVAGSARNTAVLHGPSRYSNAVLDRGRIDEGEIREEAGIASTS